MHFSYANEEKRSAFDGGSYSIFRDVVYKNVWVSTYMVKTPMFYTCSR